MVRFCDMVQCQHCGTFYDPTYTVTGRIEPHCRPIENGTPGGDVQASCRSDREPLQVSYLDFSEIEVRALGQIIDKRV